MNRGEIWTVAGGSNYAGKPRPIAILQNDRFSGSESITGCPLTTVNIDGHLFRIPVFPDERNGLRSPSWLMADKLLTIPRKNIGTRVGLLDTATLAELNRAIIVFLHLDGDGHTPPRRR
jgi:mRNA interferase MazF